MTEVPESVKFIDLEAQQRQLAAPLAEAIERVLRHGKFIMGPEVAELESRLAHYCGVRHAITCASGTDALLLPLLAWGVGPGDAVLVPTFTFAATAEVVALTGATPVFIDADSSTYNLDTDSLETAINGVRNSALRPVGVIAVDLFGRPAEYDVISRIVTRAGLWLIADAAQSFGTSVGGSRTGGLADVTATSFFPAKPLGCYGDGGAVFTDDDVLAETIRSLRIHGQGAHKYDNARVGINSRLDTLQAAILLQKLDIFDDELKARRTIADRYHEGLAAIVGVPVVDDGVLSAWAQYTITLQSRDAVAVALLSSGVPTALYYPRPLHEQIAYRGFPRSPDRLPVASALSRSVLSLPMHPYLTLSAQDHIIEAMVEAVRCCERVP